MAIWDRVSLLTTRPPGSFSILPLITRFQKHHFVKRLSMVIFMVHLFFSVATASGAHLGVSAVEVRGEHVGALQGDNGNAPKADHVTRLRNSDFVVQALMFVKNAN